MSWSAVTDPIIGPHDPNMTSRDWFNVTLARIAEDNEELANFERFMKVLRQECLAVDVETLQGLSMSQLLSAAASVFGDGAKKGMVRIVLKYLGSPGRPHEPPVPPESEALQAAAESKKVQIKWGRAGKTGANSNESNFPDAMVLSKQYAHVRDAGEIEFPDSIKRYIANEAARYSEEKPMDQGATVQIAHKMADWIVTAFGLSPVSVDRCEM